MLSTEWIKMFINKIFYFQSLKLWILYLDENEKEVEVDSNNETEKAESVVKEEPEQEVDEEEKVEDEVDKARNDLDGRNMLNTLKFNFFVLRWRWSSYEYLGF